MQGVAAGRVEIGADRRVPDHPGFPTNSRAHEQAVLVGEVLQHLTVAGFQTERREARRLLQQSEEFEVGERVAADLRQQRLLVQA